MDTHRSIPFIGIKEYHGGDHGDKPIALVETRKEFLTRQCDLHTVIIVLAELSSDLHAFVAVAAAVIQSRLELIKSDNKIVKRIRINVIIVNAERNVGIYHEDVRSVAGIDYARVVCGAPSPPLSARGTLTQA